eukprot:Skav223934  [mRNA]  locus=scaffold2593:533158:539318:+ [translate_table: standard]
MQCKAFHGTLELAADVLFPVRSGHSFVVVVLDAHSDPACSQLRDPQPSHPVQRTPRPLVLDDLIARPAVIRIPVDEVLFLRSHVPIVNLGAVFDYGAVVKWKDCTTQVFDALQPWNGIDVPLGLHFYTDGSSMTRIHSASAAVILVVITADGPYFGGWRGVTIAERPTAPVAENVAVALALLWALQIGDRFHGFHSVEVGVFYDSTLAGNFASGAWRPQQQIELATMTRALVHWLESRLNMTFSWTHVRAHRDHPLNEAADAAAWSLLHGWVSAFRWEDVEEHITVNGTMSQKLAWLWLVELSLKGHPSVPPLVGGSLQVDISAPFQHPPVASDHDLPQLQRDLVDVVQAPLERAMDVDAQHYVDDQFWTTAKDFPAWALLDQRESLDHACEPEPISVRLPEPVGPDGRSPQLREPFPCCYADQMAFLRPYTDRMILDTSGVPLGVPVVRASDGRLHVFILHMFAGRRRVGDCHFWAEHYFKEFFPDETFVLHVLSVDTAIDEQLCNILGPNYRYIAQLAAAGVFCLNLAGPPCETWTSARHLRLDAGEDGAFTGPRPLRSASRAWGVHGLTVGETRQLQTGTGLMLKSFETDMLIAAKGGALIMEHPGEAPSEDFASVWRTAFHKQYFMARHHLMVQWRYGADYVKPTVLRAVHLPRFSQEFAALADPSAKPPGRHLGGYDHFGHCFVTAAAKEYPVQMSRAMIYAAFRCLQHRMRLHGLSSVDMADVPEAALTFSAAVENKSSTVFGHEFRPDYQPQL